MEFGDISISAVNPAVVLTFTLLIPQHLANVVLSLSLKRVSVSERKKEKTLLFLISVGHSTHCCQYKPTHSSKQTL